MNSSFLNSVDSLRPTVLVCDIVMALISCFGLTGNVLICVVVFKTKSLQTYINVNLVCSAFADILGCVFLLPIRIYVYSFPSDQNEVLQIPCQIAIFFRSLCDCVKLFMLTVGSFERYRAVVHPFKKKGRCERTIVLITLSLVLAIAVSTVSVIYFKDTTLSFYCSLETVLITHQWGRHDLFLMFPLGSICLAAIFIFYALILITLFRHSSAMNKKWSIGKNKVHPSGKENNNEKDENIDLEDVPKIKVPTIIIETPNTSQETNEVSTINTYIHNDEHYSHIKNLDMEKSTNLPTVKEEESVITSVNSNKDYIAEKIESINLDRTGNKTLNKEEILDSTYVNLSCDNLNSKKIYGSSTSLGKEMCTDCSFSNSQHKMNNFDSVYRSAGVDLLTKGDDDITVEKNESINDVKYEIEDNMSKNEFNQSKESGRTLIERGFENDRTYSLENTKHNKTPGDLRNVCYLTAEKNGQVDNGKAFYIWGNEKKQTTICTNKTGGYCNTNNETVDSNINVPYDGNQSVLENEKVATMNNVKDAERDQVNIIVSEDGKNNLINRQLESTINKIDMQKQTIGNETMSKDGELNERVKHDNIQTDNIQTDNIQADIKIDDKRSDVETQDPSNITRKNTQPKNRKFSLVEVFDIEGKVRIGKTENENVVGAVCVMNPKNRVQGRRKVEVKAAKRILILIGTFIFCWLPLPLFVICIGGVSDLNLLQRHLVIVLGTLGGLTMAINPIQYGLCNRQINSAFQNMFHIQRCCKS